MREITQCDAMSRRLQGALTGTDPVLNIPSGLLCNQGDSTVIISPTSMLVLLGTSSQ